MRLSKREMVLLIILGIVLIGVLGINFLIVPMQKSLQADASLLMQKQDELVNVESDTKTSSALMADIDEAYARAQELQKPYENSLRQEEIDLWLNNMLAYNNLEVQNMDISDVGVSTADFSATPTDEQQALPIQDAADIVNGTMQSSAQPSAQPSDEASATASAEAGASPSPSAAATESAPALYQLSAVINCVGSFDDLIALCNGLYESGRALRITTLTTQEAGEDGRMPAVITIEFYGIPAVDAIGAGTGEASA
ncbi:MAG: hypothetical protein VB081_00730 [Christensenella sp.]|uniref:hypothetical protein n=1 Tax=Christensenella sp. TaxID=1935934 RepID=UPI002B21FC32|nr:hypothetical protein [Christensenella sp.]MEA5002014.1 hypothetical protein [Christensenella sp.]